MMHKWNPADYEKSSSAQYAWAVDLISSLDLRGDEHILDIGCGNGKITSHLAELVPRGRAVGIDISADMVAFARSSYPSKDHPNLSFEIGDASCLGFHEEFDVAVSFACLHWVRDHRAVLEGVRRSIRPGGKVLFQCGGKGNAAALLSVTEDMIREEKWSAYFQGFGFPYYFYSPENYRDWLTQAGLKANQMELIPKDMVHSGYAGLEGFIRTTWLPYLERLPEGLRPRFVKEIGRRYIDRHPLDNQGRVHVQMMRLQVEAERA